MIRSVFGLFVVVLLGGCWVAVRGQGDVVTIRSISAQTDDLLTFRIAVPQRLYGPRQNVVISYNVRNDGAKVAYLVTEPGVRVKVDEKNRTLLIESSVKYQEEWTRYDNDFVRLGPGQSHAGKIVIDGAEIPINPRSESEDWTLEVRFAYVFNLPKADMEELLGCRGSKYSLPCLGKLADVAKILTIGALIVEVKSS
jgi:hypothetical protein